MKGISAFYTLLVFLIIFMLGTVGYSTQRVVANLDQNINSDFTVLSNTLYINGSSKSVGINMLPTVNRLAINDTGINGVNIEMIGNGATGPRKFIRVYSGNFEVLNDGYSASLFDITDFGNIGIAQGNPSARLDVSGTNIFNNLSLNVNNTLYVNGSSNFVGIGTSNPSSLLTLERDGGAAFVTIDSYGGNSQFIGRVTDGTKASPTATSSGKILISFSGRGYDGSNFTLTRGLFSIRSAETFTPSAQGTELTFDVVKIGTTTRYQAMKIDDAANVNITGNINGAGYRINGTLGFTGTCGSATTLTVEGGIITGCA